MRGVVLLVIGAAMMVGALCFAGYAAVYAVRQPEQASETTPVIVPSDSTPSPEIVELERVEGVPRPEREKAIAPRYEEERPALEASSAPASEPPPIPEPPRAPQLEVPEVPIPEPPPGPEAAFVPEPSSDLRGGVPPADTSTVAAVETCGGGTFRLNVAEKRMFELHNEARQAHGLGPLCLADDLARVARFRAQDMMSRDYYSHDTPEGQSVGDYVEPLRASGVDRGYMIGENIDAGGDGTDSDVPTTSFDELMDSPGHRANILNDAYAEVGIGATSGEFQANQDRYTVYAMVFWGWT